MGAWVEAKKRLVGETGWLSCGGRGGDRGWCHQWLCAAADASASSSPCRAVLAADPPRARRGRHRQRGGGGQGQSFPCRARARRRRGH